MKRAAYPAHTLRGPHHGAVGAFMGCYNAGYDVDDRER
jgi:hypothetical protein